MEERFPVSLIEFEKELNGYKDPELQRKAVNIRKGSLTPEKEADSLELARYLKTTYPDYLKTCVLESGISEYARNIADKPVFEAPVEVQQLWNDAPKGCKKLHNLIIVKLPGYGKQYFIFVSRGGIYVSAIAAPVAFNAFLESMGLTVAAARYLYGSEVKLKRDLWPYAASTK